MRDRRSGLALVLLAAPVCWLFAGVLLGERVLYFRDVSVTYFPDYVYAARWLARGVWPLWHQAADAGAPFLQAYPVDLALLWLFGARATLAWSAPLHLLLAMWGTYRLARDLGRSRVASVLAGVVLGCSGLMLSSLLYPNFLASAWTPWLVVTARGLVRSPSRRRVAALAALAALQLSTFGAEAAVQTALVGLVLLPCRPGRRAVGALAGAGLLAGLLAAPALLGVAALLGGSARAAGFAPGVALAYSAGPAVLLESLLPRWFGLVHGMTPAGFWGQPFFPGGNPYYLSLYLGPGVLLLAVRGRDRRLAGLALLGVLLSLGAHGPLAAPMAAGLGPLRGPVKFFFLTTFALALLAAEGLDRSRLERAAPIRWLACAPGASLLLLAWASGQAPETVTRVLATVIPEAGAGALGVVANLWPGELAATGLLALAAGAALAAGPRTAPWAALLVALDLVRVGSSVAVSADAGFYDLRPESRRLVDIVRTAGPERVYSYGVAHSPPLHWRPELLRRNSDVWLFFLDRQALLPRAHVLDGLAGALDIDRMGWAPAGATFAVSEADSRRFAEHVGRLRLAGVRWVFSFEPLDPDLATRVAEARFDEVAEPLGLYELRGALPRAYWVPRLAESGPTLPPVPAAGRVRWSRPDPHHVVLQVDAPRGFVIVSEGFDPAWRAEGPDGPRELTRVNGRYWALPTAGGSERLDVRYRPAWRTPALAALALGLGTLAILVIPRTSGRADA